jgi:hypothetical protein
MRDGCVARPLANASAGSQDQGQLKNTEWLKGTQVIPPQSRDRINITRIMKTGFLKIRIIRLNKMKKLHHSTSKCHRGIFGLYMSLIQMMSRLSDLTIYVQT